jgi:hypothetical protein
MEIPHDLSSGARGVERGGSSGSRVILKGSSNEPGRNVQSDGYKVLG